MHIQALLHRSLLRAEATGLSAGPRRLPAQPGHPLVDIEKCNAGACPQTRPRRHHASHLRTGVPTKTNVSVGAPLVGALGRHAERNRWPAISSCRLLISSFHRSKACPVPRYGARIHTLSHRVRTSIAISPTTSARQPPGPLRLWYENSVARLRQCLGIPPISRTVIPAKAGIQRGGEGECSAGACPPPRARQQPASYVRTGVPTKTNLTVGANRPGWGPGKPSPCRPIRYTGPSIRHFRGGGNPRTLASHTHGTRETGIHAHKEPQAQAPRIHHHRRIS